MNDKHSHTTLSSREGHKGWMEQSHRKLFNAKLKAETIKFYMPLESQRAEETRGELKTDYQLSSHVRAER
jgi:hypothetical protein